MLVSRLTNPNRVWRSSLFDLRPILQPGICRFRYSVRLQFARLEAVCFRRGRERVQPRIRVQPLVVSKVYPTDQHIREFLGQWIHSLAAAAGNPFLTTGARSRFPLQFVRSPSLLTGSYSGPDLIRSVAVEMQVAEHI